MARTFAPGIKPRLWPVSGESVDPKWKWVWHDAYWVPMWDYGSAPRLYGQSGVLAMTRTGGSWAMTPGGVGYKNVSTNQEISYITTANEAWMQPTDGVTIAFVGVMEGDNSGNVLLSGMHYNSAGDDPYLAWAMARPSGAASSMVVWCNNGSFDSHTFTNVFPSGEYGKVHSYVLVINVGAGTCRLYKDGEFFDSGTVNSGSISYGIDPTICIAGDYTSSTRNPNCTALLTGAILRPFSNEEAAALSEQLQLDPFGPIRQIRHRLPSLVPAVPGAAVEGLDLGDDFDRHFITQAVLGSKGA